MIVNHTPVDKRMYFLEKRNERLILEGRNFDIIQIGDSITEEFNLSRYIYIDRPILNSGVGGDLTDTLIQRFSRDVMAFNPNLIILMIGINDIRTFFRNENHKYQVKTLDELKDKVINNTLMLIDKCERKKVIWCKILPFNQENYNVFIINELIDEINLEIEKKLKKYNNVKVFETNFMKSFDNTLDLNLTYDGLHLNDNGYLKFANKLEEYIKEQINVIDK